MVYYVTPPHVFVAFISYDSIIVFTLKNDVSILFITYLFWSSNFSIFRPHLCCSFLCLSLFFYTYIFYIVLFIMFNLIIMWLNLCSFILSCFTNGNGIWKMHKRSKFEFLKWQPKWCVTRHNVVLALSVEPLYFLYNQNYNAGEIIFAISTR